MEFGPDPLRTIVMIAEALGVSVVAFICELLRRNNEELRQRMREMLIYHGEHKPQATFTAPANATASAAAAIPATEMVSEPEPEIAASLRSSLESNHELMLARLGFDSVMDSPAGEERVALKSPEKRMKKDWNAILSRSAAAVASTAPAPVSISGAAPRSPAAPTGFHDGFVLSQLVRSRQPVSGLVVSIGVNAAQPHDGSETGEAVRALIQSLIGPEDFACQSGHDEFLLIYPRESGKAAQRRLNLVAQQLWDFQLQSLGALSILFSWGGVEVRSEAIDEAVAQASERMQETKRGRKLPTMEAHGPAHDEMPALQQAV